MLAVVVLGQHRVTSYKAVRPATLRGAPIMGHTKITWSAVCSVAPFDEGVRPGGGRMKMNRARTRH